MNRNLFKNRVLCYQQQGNFWDKSYQTRGERFISSTSCIVWTGVNELEDKLYPKGNPRNRWIEDLIGSYIGFFEELLPYGQLMSQIAFFSYEIIRQTDYSDPQVIVGLAIDEFFKDEELDDELVMLLPNLLEILLDEVKRLIQLKRSSIERWETVLAEELEKKTWFGHVSGMHEMYYT